MWPIVDNVEIARAFGRGHIEDASAEFQSPLCVAKVVTSSLACTQQANKARPEKRVVADTMPRVEAPHPATPAPRIDVDTYEAVSIEESAFEIRLASRIPISAMLASFPGLRTTVKPLIVNRETMEPLREIVQCTPKTVRRMDPSQDTTRRAGTGEIRRISGNYGVGRVRE